MFLNQTNCTADTFYDYDFYTADEWLEKKFVKLQKIGTRHWLTPVKVLRFDCV